MSAPLQQHEHFFELVHDSVMTRTVEGRINFWNHSAEELYGWRKEEAIGRVSHNLLQTRFSKPLEEIDAELIRNGVWEGKLVHTTRDGGRVVVESRWTVRLNGQSIAVVEANTPSINSELDPGERTDATTTGRKQAQDRLEQTVSSLQQHEHLFELVHDSVMTRAVEGSINFWNYSAEELYGWSKEEAIGRVSHSLLQTRFPKPLEEIDAELIRNGVWEGKLVHTTRDGRRVVVESRWTLSLNGQSVAVVEANALCTDREIDLDIRTDTYSVEIGGQMPVVVRHKWRRVTELFSNGDARGTISVVNKTLFLFGCGLSICLAITWGLYVLLGHHLIRTIHESTWLIDTIMEGRAVFPLDAYYDDADQGMVVVGIGIMTLLFVLAGAAISLREPVGALFACCSLLFCSFTIFTLVELYPSLIRQFHLENIKYYAWKGCCIPDDTLAYRYRPFFRSTIPSFKGYMYSSVYGVEVPSRTVELAADKNGFIHNNATRAFPNVVVIGDSFVADGLNEADTFGRRLEKTSGLTVANLGVPGHGPFQYVEVLKRYGIQQKPKYAFFVFYAGNDIEDMKAYLEWKNGGSYYGSRGVAEPFWGRYLEALRGVARLLGSVRDDIGQMMLLTLKHSNQSPEGVHPDIAVVETEHSTYRMLIPAENKIKSSAELLLSPEGRGLRQILAEFKDLCMENGIVPIVMFIPTVTTIYAELSNHQSGAHWLRWRDEQIAQKRTTENAVAVLTRSLNIRLISLSPVFESAAAQGKLLYHPFDTHWNSEGKQVAAAHVAEALKAIDGKQPQ